MENSSKITKGSGSNFVPAFYFLPKEKRSALTTIYAFCRLTDDIVDQVSHRADPNFIKGELSRWKSDTEQALNGKGVYPVLNELGEVVQKYGIDPQDVLCLIDGVGMDIEKKNYGTFDELKPYCYGVASTVGLMCLPIFGAKRVETKEYAINLGIAFQLTNILRDVRTDGERGRIYIPLEDLMKFGFTKESWLGTVTFSLREMVTVPGFKELIRFEGKRAEGFYQKSAENLLQEERPFLLAPLMMTSVYHAVLKKILSRPERVLRTKVKLSKLEILFRLLGVWFIGAWHRRCLAPEL